MACQEVKIEAPDGKDVDVTIRLGVVWGDKMLKRLQEDITENLSLSAKVRRLEQQLECNVSGHNKCNLVRKTNQMEKQISTILAKLNQETKDLDRLNSARSNLDRHASARSKSVPVARKVNDMLTATA